MGTRLTKQQKQEWMSARFNQARTKGINLDKEKLIAAFVLDNFSSRKSAQELLELYAIMGIITIKDNEVIVRR